MAIRSSRHWSRWTLFVAFWTLVGLSFAVHFFLNSSKAGQSVSWGEAVAFSLGDWYVFAVLSIPVMKLARAFPFERRTWGRGALGHVIFSVLFSFVYIVFRALLLQVQTWLNPGLGLPFGRAFPLLSRT